MRRGVVLATVKGRRPRHREEHHGVVLRCNNYEVVDLSVMVPAESPDTGRAGLRHRRPLGLMGVARRDGQRCEGDGAARARAAAVDGRGHDVTPHTAVRIARIHAGDRACDRRLASYRCGLLCWTPCGRSSSTRENPYCRSGERAARGARRRPLLPFARQSSIGPDRLARGGPRRPVVRGRRVSGRRSGSSAGSSTGRSSHAWELKGRFPGSSTTRSTARPRANSSTPRMSCSTGSSDEGL